MRSHSSSLPATAADLTRKWLSVRPLVVIAIGFAVSIGFCNLGTIGICILLIAAVALSITPGSGSWMRRAGAIASVLGLLWAWMAFHPAQSDVSRLLGASRVNVSGVLVDAPERHTYGWTAILSVDEAQRMGERAQSSSGLLKVYLGGEENIPAPQAGDRIRVSGALESPRGAAFEGGFDETNYLRTQGIFATMRVRSPRYWHLEGADRSVASMAVRGAAGLRQDLLDRLSSVLPQAQAGLLAGIMLGSRSILPPVISDDMAQAGISHITASSGTNVAFAALCVCWIAARLGFSRRMRSVTGIVGVTLYTILAGATPSVVRADLMATIILAAGLFDREPDMGCALAAAALISLAWHPGDLFNPGFQLSYACVIGLVASASVFQSLREKSSWKLLQPADYDAKWTHKTASVATDAAAATVTAQFASGPILMQQFNVTPLAGFLANGLALWNVFLLMALGFVLWPVLVLAPGIGAILAIPIGWLLTYEIGVARWCAGLPFSSPSIASMGWPMVVVVYALLGIALLLAHAKLDLARRERNVATTEATPEHAIA